MKKRIMMAACSVAGLAAAQLMDIQCENEVGVTKVETSGNTILAVPYVKCLEGCALAVTNLVSTYGLRSAANGGSANEADQLLLWDMTVGSYKSYYYNTTEGWTETPGAKLGDAVAAITEEAVCGAGFWLKRPANATGDAYLQGQIDVDQADEDIAIVIEPGLNLIAMPITTEHDLNAFNWTGASVGTRLNSAATDQILITDAGQLHTYVFHEGVWKTRDTQTWQFVPAESIPISAGKGFWYNRRGEGRFTFKPYAPMY